MWSKIVEMEWKDAIQTSSGNKGGKNSWKNCWYGSETFCEHKINPGDLLGITPSRRIKNWKSRSTKTVLFFYFDWLSKLGFLLFFLFLNMKLTSYVHPKTQGENSCSLSPLSLIFSYYSFTSRRHWRSHCCETNVQLHWCVLASSATLTNYEKLNLLTFSVAFHQ